MDAVLKVVGTIAAIWLVVSILVVVVWATVGRRIFRTPPAPPSREVSNVYDIDREGGL